MSKQKVMFEVHLINGRGQGGWGRDADPKKAVELARDAFKDIGGRPAKWAVAKVYGRKVLGRIEPSGFRSWKRIVEAIEGKWLA